MSVSEFLGQQHRFACRFVGLTASGFQPCAHHAYVGAVMGVGGGLPRGNLILKVEVTPVYTVMQVPSYTNDNS